MTSKGHPRSELLSIAERLRHLRAGADGAVRRKLEAEMAEMAEVAAHLDRRLATLLPDEADRVAWRAHARHGDSPPERPDVAERGVRARRRNAAGPGERAAPLATVSRPPSTSPTHLSRAPAAGGARVP